MTDSAPGPDGPHQGHARDLLVLAAILGLVATLVVVIAVLRDPGPKAAASVNAPDLPPSLPASGPPSTPPGELVPTDLPTDASGSPGKPGKKASELAAAAQTVVDAPRAFRLATFNVLGASHTTKSGDSSNKHPYDERLPYAIQLLAAHHADVVGFQEFESPQASLFEKLAGKQWGLFPAAGSGDADGRNSIAWRRDVWDLVQGTALTVPYFDGMAFRTPMVELRYRATGEVVWFINVHNAADTWKYHGQEPYRDQATAIEIAKMKELSADGTPVVLMGDMNEHEEFFCTVAASGLPVLFANGGSWSADSCTPPEPTPIDWMVGVGMSFTGFYKDTSKMTRIATDHPVYSVTAVLNSYSLSDDSAVGSGQNQ